MNRFFVAPSAILGEQVAFPPDLARQIDKVLRLDVHTSQVLVLDNSGKSYLVQLTGWQGKTLIGRIVETYLPVQEDPMGLELAFSLSKREKLEWILQKGTELGVTRFRPFVSERSLDRSLQLAPSRLTRWQSILREAAEQCRRDRLPNLDEPLPYAQVIQAAPRSALRLIAWEEADPSQQLSANYLAQVAPGPIRSVVVLVGPEGGLSAEEVTLAESYGFHTFSLGRRTLRMETACLAACAILSNLIES